jgi:hypothetical protein
MTDLISPSVETLFQQLLQEKSLSFSLREEWGSHSEGYREKIHQELVQRAAEFSDSSISHAHGLGGFAGISTPFKDRKIGFDIELVSRVTPELARRISSNPQEAASAPSPAHLWVAKESAFKALNGPLQPQVLSQVGVVGWQKAGSHIETFRLANDASSAPNGVVYTKLPFIFGIFIFSPQNLP